MNLKKGAAIGLCLLTLLFFPACNRPNYRMVTTSKVGERILQLKYAQKFDSDQVELYTIEHFLTDEECSTLVGIIKNSNTPSPLAGKATKPYDASGQKIRTSHTTYLASITDAAEKDYMSSIVRKISQAIGIPIEQGEAIQGQYYRLGQELKTHLDAFEPGSQAWEESSGPTRGNRTWTFMIYLNDVEEGGSTYFSELNHYFFPKKGRAVVWNNLYEDGTRNFNVYHSGQPVKQGEKVIITQWFRQYSTAGEATDS